MTDDIRPLTFRWDGEVMRPLNPKLADRYYVVEELYRLAPWEERSYKTHNHYFAALHDAWENLPEEMADRIPSPEHLRKWALIKAGYRNERSVAFNNPEDAQRAAAFMKPLDDYAVVVVHENIVTVYTAKSQSMRSQGKAEFQRSKEAVLDIVAKLANTDAEALKKNAERVA